MLIDLPTAARYNQWANARIYGVARKLSDKDLWEDRKGFFKSIAATMNHILLADVLYGERLQKKQTKFKKLDEILYNDFAALETAHKAQDKWYIEFCDSLPPKDLDGTLSFDTVETGEHFSLPLRMCLTNLFQHQIHHRGQVHHMISHAGLYPPPVDFIKFASGE